MKLSKYQLFFFILPLLHPHRCLRAHSVQVPSELGKGNADIVSPQAENAIFYNPASLLTPISAYSLGLSYNLLGRRLNELANKISSLKDDKQRQVEEVETLIGKPLHISSFMGGAFIPRPHTGFGFYVHTLANSIVRGRVLLILDMSVVMRSGLIVPVARPFVHRQLVLGIALKPSYKFEHLVHRDAFEIFEDSSIIKPTERGKEGFGLGLDFGLLMVKHFVNRILKLGGSIRNFGGLKYKRMSYLAKPGSAAPSSDKPQVALGGRLQQQVYFGSRFDLTAHYAYLWDDGLDYHHATSHQYGLSFTLFRGLLELSAGRYKNQQSYGLKASLRFLTLYFGFYRDAWGGGGTSAGDGRHFVQLSSTW